MSKQTAPPLQQHAIDSSTSIPSMSAEHEEDSCRLLNEDGTPIFIDELINAHGYNMEQHSAASPNGITNEGLNHQHSIPPNAAAESNVVSKYYYHSCDNSF